LQGKIEIFTFITPCAIAGHFFFGYFDIPIPPFAASAGAAWTAFNSTNNCNNNNSLLHSFPMVKLQK
jgi:hypothetical protein